MSTDIQLIFTTVPDAALAETIAQQLIASGLAACVKTLPACTATFRWEGKIEQAAEIPLMIVAPTVHYASLEQQLKALHPYDVPEILAIDCTDGLPDYLQWARASGSNH